MYKTLFIISNLYLLLLKFNDDKYVLITTDSNVKG